MDNKNNSKKTDTKNSAGTNKSLDLNWRGRHLNVEINVKMYMDGNMAILMMSECEPLAKLTINTGNACPQDHAFIDVNNLGKEILSWIINNKLAIPTGWFSRGGYCIYPEYRFDPEVLRKLDPEGYAKYLEDRRLVLGC